MEFKNIRLKTHCKLEKNQRNEKENKQKIKNKMIDLGPNISITLNINNLSIPISRQRLAEWIKKKDPTICLSIRNSLQIQ